MRLMAFRKRLFYYYIIRGDIMVPIGFYRKIYYSSYKMNKKLISIISLVLFWVGIIGLLIEGFMNIILPEILYIDVAMFFLIVGISLRSIYRWYYYEKEQLSKGQNVAYGIISLIGIIILIILFKG